MNNTSSNLSNRKGLSLVEIQVSFLILTVVMLATVSVYAKCDNYLSDIREYTVASQIIKGEMEKIRNNSFGDIEDADLSSVADVPFLLSPNFVKFVDSPPGDLNQKRVSLNLTWTSHSGRPASLELTTYVTKFGLNG